MTTTAKVIPASTYRTLKDANERYEQARKAFDPKRFQRGGGYSPDDQRQICAIAGITHPPTNEDREAIGVYELMHDKPDHLFCYIDEKQGTAKLWSDRSIVGHATLGKSYKSPGFGTSSTRVPVTVKAINGCVYAGTYYKSSGDYARLKKTKGTCTAAATGGGGARAKKPTRLDDLRASLPKGWTVETYAPGDGTTRYRFFHKAPPSQTYFGPNDGAFTALGLGEAEACARGLHR